MFKMYPDLGFKLLGRSGFIFSGMSVADRYE
jgi:hypothetical protein